MAILVTILYLYIYLDFGDDHITTQITERQGTAMYNNQQKQKTSTSSTPLVGPQYISLLVPILQKHRKNCECCPVSLLIVR